MKRRAFITLLGGAAAWPLAARAQQISKPARLGYIWIGAKDSEHSTRDGLRQGLRDLGYVEGRDFGATTSRHAYPVAYLLRFRGPRDPPRFVFRSLRSRFWKSAMPSHSRIDCPRSSLN